MCVLRVYSKELAYVIAGLPGQACCPERRPQERQAALPRRDLLLLREAAALELRPFS